MNSFSVFFPAAGSVSIYGSSLGIPLIETIQSAASPPLTVFMLIITNLVSQAGFFLLLPVLYWCWNEKKAFRLGLLIIVSLWANDLAKNFFGMPRPFHLEGSLGMIPEEGYGFPSGHAQLSLTLLFPLARWLTEDGSGGLKKARPLVWVLTCLLLLLIGFSRLYLGVHFLWDLAGGWVLGGILLAGFFVLPLVFRFLKKAGGGTDRGGSRSLRPALTAAALVSLGMNAFHPGNTLPGALFFGFSLGFALMRKYFPFSAPGFSAPEPSGGVKGPDRVFLGGSLLRSLAGLAGAALIYLGLKAVFPGSGSPYYGLFRFARYAVLGFWVSGGAPWIFRRFPSRYKPASSGEAASGPEG
ncbi:MAG: phosphatase PAP2 family protein [Treponema sp.]|nr:phosphatase PAP2 family protein [Treponema sp.]